MIGRTSIVVLRATLVLASIVLILTLFAGWRLSQEPLRLEFLTERVERQLSEVTGLPVGVGFVEVSWQDGGPFVVGRDVTVSDGVGDASVALPAVGVRLATDALLIGRVEARAIEFEELSILLRRDEDGTMALRVEGAEPPSGMPHGGWQGGLPAIASWLGDEIAPGIAEIRVVDARLDVDDRLAGFTWIVPRLDATFTRSANGRLTAAATAVVTLPSGRKAFELDAVYEPADRLLPVSVRFADVVPANLAEVFPALSPLAALKFPVDGRIDVHFDEQFVPLAGEAELATGGGEVEFGDRRFEFGPSRVTGSAVSEGPGFRLGGATISLGGREVDLSGWMLRRDDGWAGSIDFSGLDIRSIAAVADVGTLPSGLALVTSGTATFALDESGLREAVLAVEDGSAHVAVAPFDERALDVRDIRLDADWDGAAERLVLSSLLVTVDGIAIEAAGEGVRAEDAWIVGGRINVPEVPTGTVFELWPDGVAENGREWLTENITGGFLDGATVQVNAMLDPVMADPGSALEDALDLDVAIEFAARDLTVRYWEPLPPVSGVSGRGRFAGDAIDVVIEGGHSEGLLVTGATLAFRDLGGEIETVQTIVDVTGPMDRALAILDRPPLEYAAYLDLDPEAVSGGVETRLRVALPLLEDITIEEVDIRADALLTDARVPGLVADRTLSDAEVQLTVDQERLDAGGNGFVEGVPLDFQMELLFDEEADPNQRFRATATLDQGHLRSLGMDEWLPIDVSGVIGFDVTAAGFRDGTQRVNVLLDVRDAAFEFPWLDWGKAPDTPGVADAELVFSNGRLVTVPDFSLDTAGAGVTGSATFGPDGEPERIELSRVRLSQRFDLRGTVTRTGDRWDVRATGDRIDVRPLLTRMREPSGEDGASVTSKGTSLDIRIIEPLSAVVVGSGPPLTDVTGAVEIVDGDEITATLEGKLGTGRVDLDIRPDGFDQSVIAEAGDAGALLAALGVTDRVRGGNARVEASRRPDDAGAPAAGTLTMRNFRVVEAPLLAHILTAASITGPLTVLQAGEGLAFTELEAPFELNGEDLHLLPGRAYGNSIGITFGGDLDLAADTLALRGTIVPAYTINRILGAIPVLGYLLTGGEDEGLFAASYSVEGPLDAPDVRVNPLSALAPGFVRDLIGRALEADGAAADVPPVPPFDEADPAGGDGE